MHLEVVGKAQLPPSMPTRITVMADSDGSPQRDDCHHRRSRSRSPVSPEWTGETPTEREEWRLAEPAVLVGPPAGQPRAASANTRPSTQEPEPAKVTAPAAQAAGPAVPPWEGAPDARGLETAAPASHAAAPTAAPGTPPTRGVAPAQEPGASPRAAAAAEGSGEGTRGVATAIPMSRATASAGHAAAPSTPQKRGKYPCTGHGPRQPHPHPHQPPEAVPPQALPPGADGARAPPSARALAAWRHAAALHMIQEGGDGAQAELRASHGSAERGTGAREVPRSMRKERARARAAGSKGAAAEGDRARAAERLRAGGREGARAR